MWLPLANVLIISKHWSSTLTSGELYVVESKLCAVDSELYVVDSELCAMGSELCAVNCKAIHADTAGLRLDFLARQWRVQ